MRSKVIWTERCIQAKIHRRQQLVSVALKVLKSKVTSISLKWGKVGNKQDSQSGWSREIWLSERWQQEPNQGFTNLLRRWDEVPEGQESRSSPACSVQVQTEAPSQS